MLQLVGLILIGTLGYLFWRGVKREMARVSDKVERAAKKKTENRNETVQTLEQDPKTGVYRPREGDE